VKAVNCPTRIRSASIWIENGTFTWKDNLGKTLIKGGPAGGGYATAIDLLKFSQALRNNTLVSPETREILFAPKDKLNSPYYG